MDFRQYYEANFGDAPFFTYQGSKATIREWVLQSMPHGGRWYVEPFGGRGNVFFLARKRLKFKKWHINDLNSSTFFNHLSSVDVNTAPDKINAKHFDKYKYNRDDPWSHILEPEISHLGHYRAGFRGNYGVGKDWKYSKEKYTGKVKEAQDLLKNVQITNLTWDQMPYASYNREDFIYFDPPYLDTDNRYYKDIDHKAFLRTVKGLKCRWLLSHSDHPLYRKMLGQPYNEKERRANLVNSQGRSASLVECLWKGGY